MTRHRTIILIAGSLAAFVAVPSNAALASSLLSGYGGPGQGNQAILGSALLNGPGGGGSGSSGSSSQASGAGSSTSGAGAATSSGVGSGARSGSGAGGSSSRPRGSAGGAPSGRSGARSTSRPSIADVYAAAERSGPTPSAGAFGLSGADLLLIALALGMLALIGVLSRRLTRVPPPADPRRAGGG